MTLCFDHKMLKEEGNGTVLKMQYFDYVQRMNYVWVLLGNVG